MKRQNSNQICQTSLKYLRSLTPIPTKFDTKVSSLLNLAAKVVAESIPYELIERCRKPVIPEVLQHKIILYSFPRKEQDIYIYSSYGLLDKSTDNNKKLSFYQGINLLEKNAVTNVMQIGFHLNGVVQDSLKSSLISRKSESTQTFYVSVTFDRCKITSVDCTCSHQGLFWCPHIVALALFRIRKPDQVQFREPISESLVRMDRDQLQKFAQYLIASHPNQVLSSAQNLVDELLQTDSTINQIYGAPDPTAGAGLTEPEPQWHLNESQIRDQVSHQLGSVSVNEVPPALTAMCGKVREMLRHQDSNGARLLALLTDQCLMDSRLAIFRARQAEMWPSYRELWDELGRLWVCVLLCPYSCGESRAKWRHKLLEWSQLDNCPPEDWDYASNNATRDNSNAAPPPPPNNTSHSATSEVYQENNGSSLWWYQPSTVFRLPLIASELSWDHEQLHQIIYASDKCPPLSSGTNQSNDHQSAAAATTTTPPVTSNTANQDQIWSEQIQLSCLRVLALRSNGLHDEALRLSLAIARYLISQRNLITPPPEPVSVPPPPPPIINTLLCQAPSFFSKHHQHCSTLQPPHPPPPSSHNNNNSQPDSSTQLFQPIGNFYQSSFNSAPTDITCTNLPDLSPGAAVECAGWIGLAGNPIRVLTECLLSSPNSPSDTQTPTASTTHSLGLHIALLALCQPRTMPQTRHAQERCLHHESRLLSLLATLQRNDHDLCTTLQRTIRTELAQQLPQCSTLAVSVPHNSYPMHSAANFLFKWLLLFDQELAYTLVKRAMRLPLLEQHSDQHHQPQHQHQLDRGQSGSSIPHHLLHHHHAPIHPPINTGGTHTLQSTPSRWPVLRRIEAAQCELALSMIQASRDCSARLDQVLRVCDRHIHSSTALFRLSQDICAKCSMNAGLRCAVLQLALNVAGRTLRHPRSHWRRREMVQWLVGCAAGAGPPGLLYLCGQWRHYVSAKEAVLQVASPLLLAAGGAQAAVDERVRRHVRRMAVDAAARDPVHCGMRALALSEKEPELFEAAYAAIHDAAERGALAPPELFSLGRYLEPRARRRQAYQLALLACAATSGPPASAARQLPPNTELDIVWACSLAQSLGTDCLTEMLNQLVRRVSCPLLLAEVLHRARLTHTPPHKQLLPLTEPPLLLLLNATVDAFLNSTHSRLNNISPRHYNDFLDFLYKARDVFQLIVPDGSYKFRQLIFNIRHSHRGKKKLNLLLKERFLYDTNTNNNSNCNNNVASAAANLSNTNLIPSMQQTSNS